MVKTFKKGKKTLEHSAGMAHGEVKRKPTSRTKVGGQEIATSKPYLVVSTKIGKEAAHKPDSSSAMPEPCRSPGAGAISVSGESGWVAAANERGLERLGRRWVRSI